MTVQLCVPGVQGFCWALGLSHIVGSLFSFASDSQNGLLLTFAWSECFLEVTPNEGFYLSERKMKHIVQICKCWRWGSHCTLAKNLKEGIRKKMEIVRSSQWLKERQELLSLQFSLCISLAILHA